LSFKPFVIYSGRLPSLKPGHFIKVADKMYQVVVVRHNRQPITLDAGAVATAIALNAAINEAFQALHGKIKVGRITHMQYLALTTGVDVVFRWMVEPLGSKYVAIAYDSTVAAVDAPVEVDRWSHDESMRLAYTKDAGAQTAIFEMVEYEVKTTEIAPKKYLKILPNGQAAFIDATKK
jgi:hypothetical protein